MTDIYFSGNTQDKEFVPFRNIVEHVLLVKGNPTLKEINDNNLIVICFHNDIAYFIRGNRIIIKDEIKINPADYYPSGYRHGDSIPKEIARKMLADKLGIDEKLLEGLINSDFTEQLSSEEYDEWLKGKLIENRGNISTLNR